MESRPARRSGRGRSWGLRGRDAGAGAADRGQAGAVELHAAVGEIDGDGGEGGARGV